MFTTPSSSFLMIHCISEIKINLDLIMPFQSVTLCDWLRESRGQGGTSSYEGLSISLMPNQNDDIILPYFNAWM